MEASGLHVPNFTMNGSKTSTKCYENQKAVSNKELAIKKALENNPDVNDDYMDFNEEKT